MSGAIGILKFSEAFGRGRGDIPNTIFKGGQTSLYRSRKNTVPRRGSTTPMACLSFSMGKAIASMANVLGFGVTEVEGQRRYILEIDRPTGAPMWLEYSPSENRIYHECSAQGGTCYHVFELAAAVIMAQDPQGELAEHFHRLDLSRTITDEKNFFIACDALYFDGKELMDGAEIWPLDPNADRVVVEDLTGIIHPGKTGTFSFPVSPNAQTAAAAQQPASTGAQAPIDLTLDWGRDFTPFEEELIDLNVRKLQGKELPAEMIPLAKQLRNGTVRVVLFMGPAGTAKTTTARLLARELNMPVVSQNFSLNAEELDIIGGFVPDEVNGGFKWQDGLLTRMFRDGGMYIAEEINFAKPGVLGVLNNALDDVGEIVLRNGEVVQRHPNFRFIACINNGYAGTQRMNLALINRMQRVVKFDDMEKTKQVEIVMRESGYQNRAVIERMVEVGEAIREKLRMEQVDNAVFSIRNLIAWASDVLETKDILKSAWATVVWPVCIEDEDVQKEIFEDIINPRFQGVRP